MVSHRPKLVVITILILLIGGGLAWADEQQAKSLLEQGKRAEAAGRGNQAYRHYQQILRKHPTSTVVVEARYLSALYQFKRRSYWQVSSGLQPALANKKTPLSPLWRFRYQYLIAQAWVFNNNQANAQKVPYLKQAIAHLQRTQATQAALDEAFFLLARAHAGPHRYTTRNPRKEDARRLNLAIEVYQKIIAANAERGDRAARARFELGALWALHLRNLKSRSGFFKRARTYDFSKTGKDYDARFRGGVANGLAIFEQIEKQHAGSQWAARAGYARAWVRDQLLLELRQAVVEYRSYADRYPTAKLARNALARIAQITAEQLSLGNTRILRPGSKPVLQVSVRNIASARVKIYALELDRVLAESRDHNFSRAAEKYVRSHASKPLTSYLWTTGCRDDHLGLRASITLPLTKPGAYLVEASGRTRVARTLVVLSDLSLATVTTNGKTLAMVSSLTTNLKVAGAKVVSWRRGRATQRTTGADGMALLERPDNRRSGQLLVVARHGAHHALTGGYTQDYQNRAGLHRTYVTTDRPLYRPGHDVRFKLVARRHDKGGYHNIAGTQLRIRALSPRGTPVYEKFAVADAQGAFAGSFKLKQKAMLGLYRFEILLDGKQSNWYQQAQGGTFRVEEYKKPEFLISVRPGSGDYVPGDKVEMISTTRYYDGQPVRLGRVQYQVHWQRYSPPSVPMFRLNGPVRQGRRGRRSWRGRRWNPSRMIARGSGTTDERGVFRVVFQSYQAKKKPRPAGQPVGDGIYTVRVQVVDKSRRQVSGQGRITVVSRGILVRMQPARNLSAPGKAVSIAVRLTTPGGQPIGAKGHVTLRRSQGKQWPVVRSFPLTVGPSGGALFVVKPQQEGFYKIDFTSSDRRDNPVDASAYLFVAGDAYQGGGLSNQLTTQHRLLPDRPDYDVGQTARFLLTQPGFSGTAFVFLSADRQLISRRSLMLNKGGAVFSVKIRPELAPNFYVTAVLMRPSGLSVYRQEIRVTASHRRLSISLEPDQPHYRPGEQASVAVRLLGPDGKPLQTAFWLTVFDTSLLAIQPELARSILDQFYGHRRSYQAQLTHSFSWWNRSRTDWLPGKRPRRRHARTREPEALRWRYWASFSGWSQGNFWQASKDPKKKPGRGKLLRDGRSLEAQSAPTSRSRSAKSSGRKADAPGKRQQLGNEMDDEARSEEQERGLSAGPTFKKATVRRNFQDTAHWVARVETDAEGRGTVRFEFPDNLTTWQITARAATANSLVGQASRTVRTRKLIRVRLAAPRFFTERDEVVISAVVANHLRSKKQVKIVLLLGGGTLSLKGKGGVRHERVVTLEPGKDYRADWRVQVKGSGRARIQLQALTDVESDAVEKTFNVVRHGIVKHEGQSGALLGKGGKLAGDRSVSLLVDVPAARDVGSTELRVVLAPSVAVTALEALPYLAAYPYGCVEQTMSRFGPTVLVKYSLTQLGLPIEALVGDKRGSKIPSGLWGKPHYRKMRVLRGAQLAQMVESGLARLYAFQHADGGWGWWKRDRTNRYMTAYVVDGLLTARDSDVPVRADVIRRSLAYLTRYLLRLDISRFEPKAKQRYSSTERNRISYLAYVVLRGLSGKSSKQRSELVALAKQMAENNDGLTPYAQALVALTCHAVGARTQARALVGQLTRSARTEAKNGDVSWGATRGWWRWYRDPVETAAFALRALIQIQPDSPLIPGVVQYLVHARRGTRWHSTKTTAIAVAALIDYLKVSGELDPDFTATVKYDGKTIGTVRFTKANLLGAENTFRISGSEVQSGPKEITIEKRGRGNLYYAAFVRYFTLEEDITPAGYRIAVKRSFSRIRNDKREPLASGSRLVSGDIVEVTLEIDSDRDYEYLALEDRKAAGLEALRQTSGRGPGIATHMEMRDDRVVLFASRVPKGKSRIVYRFRAEAPGEFHALPLIGYLMYAPDIRANSAEWRVKITDE